MNKKSLLLLVILLAAGVYWYSTHMAETGQNKGDLVSVTVTTAYRMQLHDSVEALGTAYANESITITANASETLKSILFDDGQIVKNGDVIALLEQDEEKAELKAAQAQLAEHQRELKRLETLLQNKAASRRDFDERATQVEITRQNIEAIKARIEDRTLRAPFDGVLGLRRLSVGALVQPGQVITTIDDIHQIKLDFNVPDIHLGKLQPGTAIDARSESLGEEVFRGSLATVNSRVDSETRSVLVRAIIPNPNGDIRPGILMHVTLLKNERQALVVPEEGVFQKQDKHFLFRVNPATYKVEQREVAVSKRLPGIIEIASGIEEGDMVIVRGIDMVKDGQEVVVREIWGSAKTPETGNLSSKGE